MCGLLPQEVVLVERLMERFKCLQEKCGLKFEGKEGPTVCPKCGSIWVRWDREEKD